MFLSAYRAPIAAGTVVAAALAEVSVAQAQENISQFNIANITDFHGYISATAAHPGAAMLKCAVDEATVGRASFRVLWR